MGYEEEHRVDHVVKMEEEIVARIYEMGAEASERYRDEKPIFVIIKDGAERFANLFFESATKHGLEFETGSITVKSMEGKDSSGSHRVVEDYRGPDLKGRKVVFVEDIIDTGDTIKFLLNHFKQYAPTIIKTIVLFAKKERRKVKNLKFDDIGFIVRGFVVGFGLDFDGYYRELKDLWVVLFAPYSEDELVA